VAATSQRGMSLPLRLAAVPVEQLPLVEVGQQPQQPVQAMWNATQTGCAPVLVDGEHMLQRREDVDGVIPDPFRRRGKARPQARCRRCAR
jgi:hypothetical protein